MCSTDLAIVTQKFNLTSMQMAALRARVNAPSHAQAARNMRMSRQSFWNRISRAMAKMDWQTRQAVRETFPCYPNRRERVMVGSLEPSAVM
jgi:hypothetical protein